MNTRRSAPDTSPSLLLRVRNPDDDESWVLFERLYGSIVRSYCQYWKLQPVDADDITQEVMVAVAQGIRRFDYDPAKGRFRAWLGTVTVNKIKRFMSRRSKQTEFASPIESSEVSAESAYNDPDDHWVELFSEQVFIQACKNVRPSFEEKSWRCFEATWIEKESPQSVAKSLGIAVHAVYVNKARVIKRLEQEVKSLAEDLAIDE